MRDVLQYISNATMNYCQLLRSFASDMMTLLSPTTRANVWSKKVQEADILLINWLIHEELPVSYVFLCLWPKYYTDLNTEKGPSTYIRDYNF